MRTVLQRWKSTLQIAVASLLVSIPSVAANQDVMCLKTNKGTYFPVVRVSMMVVTDGGTQFDILLKDGQGEAGVESVSFEKHNVDINFDDYRQNSDGTPYIDMTKPVYMYTNTGKFWLVKDMPVINVQEGSNLMDVKVGGDEAKGVAGVFFYRGTEDGLNEAVTGINNPVTAQATEKLQLLTPISEQMIVSGCGNASLAIVYSLDGKKMTDAPVANGVTTVSVRQLPKGAYVLRVGNKAMKFIKK